MIYDIPICFLKIENDILIFDYTNDIIEEYTPKLFSDDQSLEKDNISETKEYTNGESEQLFDQDIEEEDFEIPAFLRKQKF